MADSHTRRRLAIAVMAAGLSAAPRTTDAQSPATEDLQRQMRRLQEQVEELRGQVKEQQRVIEQLKGEKASPAATAAPPAAATPPPPAPPAPVETATAPWTPAAPISLLRGGRGYLNISFDALIDAGWSTDADVPQLETGDHDPNQRGFSLPNEEIFLDGAVDPYFRGVADIVFKLNEENETQVELEEVYLTTLSLPWNLQAKTGQYFTEFGRINQQHPHAWDFVDQPLVIGRFFGPEGLRNPGARLSWLLPVPFYSELYASVQNSQGGTAFSFRNEEDPPFDRPPVSRPVTGLGDMLWVPRWVTSFDLTDSQTLVAGVSGAFGPNASGENTYTQIYGGDVYWKWKPSWQSGGFPFVSFQGEVLGREYEAGRAVVGGAVLPAETVGNWGWYAQVLYGFTQRWVAGLRGEWVSGGCGASAGISQSCAKRSRFSPDLTFYPTEFSKLRLQYNFDHSQAIGDDSSVWLQIEFLLGDHAAHKF
jgi:hypothetical protein